MIKLGKLTDYAIVVMGQLAKEGKEASRSASYLSEKTGVPEPTVAKVLKLLAKGNLLESMRGATGGYKLSRAPEQISMADIVTVLDGPIALVACAGGGDGDCKVSDTCPVKGHWGPLNAAVQSAFEKVSLADMVSPSCGSKCA